jgi:hypothetical protein
MQITFPRIFSFALDQKLSVNEVISAEDRLRLFQLPLSPQAYQEYEEFQGVLNQVWLNAEVNGIWLTI